VDLDILFLWTVKCYWDLVPCVCQSEIIAIWLWSTCCANFAIFPIILHSYYVLVYILTLSDMEYLYHFPC